MRWYEVTHQVALGGEHLYLRADDDEDDDDDNGLIFVETIMAFKGNMHKPDLKIRFWCVYIP